MFEKDPFKAIEYHEKANQTCPNVAWNLFYSARAYVAAGDLESARIALEQVRTVIPNGGRNLIALAAVYISLGDTNSALDIVNGIIERLAGKERASVSKYALRELPFENALAVLELFSEQDAQDSYADEYIARVYLEKGNDSRNAIRYLERAIEKEKDAKRLDYLRTALNQLKQK